MAVAGDDDATPEAAFENVPRRRRSAAAPSGPAPRPREDEELGGGDDPGRSGSSAPPPSRDADDSPHDRRAEKRRRLLRAEDAKNGGGGGAPPAATAASEWAEKERIRKGKMAAAVEASPAGAGPGGGKLMGDAIRCHGGSKDKNKKKPKSSKKRKGLGLGPPFWYGMGRDGQSTSTAGSGENYSFDSLGGAVVSAGLRAALAGANAGAPVRVYGRLMSGCDRNTHQSRLQMSCKSWRAAEDGEYPVCAFLTAAERVAAHGEGLVLKAYDRRGREYDLKLRYLACNSSYRLISKWGDLLRNNGLVVDKGAAGDAEPVMLELWLFRPPGGAVGMVVLHYYKGDAKHADAALEEEEDRRRATKSRRLADDAYSTPGGKVMEDGANGKGEGYGDVNGEAAASPAEEPDGGAKEAAEEQAGGAPRPSEVAAALSPDADGTKAEEKEAGGAPVEVAPPPSSDAAGGAAPGEADGAKTAEEKNASAAPMEAAAAQPASPSGAGGAAKAVGKEADAAQGEEAAPPPPPADDAGGAKKAASRFGLTVYEWWAARALVQLSQS